MPNASPLEKRKIGAVNPWMYSCQENHVVSRTDWTNTSRKVWPCTIRTTAKKRRRSSARKRPRWAFEVSVIGWAS